MLDMVLIEQSEFPVLQVGETATVSFAIQNSGLQRWEPGTVRLENVSSSLLTYMPAIDLIVEVPPGQTTEWSFPVIAALLPGVHSIDLQMVYADIELGPPMSCDIIVVPPGSNDLQGQIEQLIAEQKRRLGERFEQEWDRIRKEIEDLIRLELERLWQQFTEWLEQQWRRLWEGLVSQCCGAPLVPPAAVLLGTLGLRRRKKRR